MSFPPQERDEYKRSYVVWKEGISLVEKGATFLIYIINREEMASSFTGTQDKCKACDKTVYFVDLLSADGANYHKACFKCSHCKGTLVVCIYIVGVLHIYISLSMILDTIVSLTDEQLLIHGWRTLLQDSFWTAFQGVWKFQQEFSNWSEISMYLLYFYYCIFSIICWWFIYSFTQQEKETEKIHL